MRRALCCLLALAAAGAGAQAPPASAPDPSSVTRTGIQASIQGHLGRPYVWGSCGMKSFDCSGFVWRVMLDNGVLIKRTTARKLYLVLPKVGEADRWTFGNVVFFSNRKHCGLVNSRDAFYHAQTSKGTNLSAFDPLWRGRICGVRSFPRAAARDTSRSD